MLKAVWLCLLCLICGTPIGFAISLIMFIKAYRANQKVPDTYSRSKVAARLTWLVITSVLLGILLLLAVGVIILLSGAISFM